MKARFFLFLALSFLMYGCDCIEGEGELINEKRDVSGFDMIKLDMSARIILTQDSVFSMMIEAQQNILDILTTDVKFKKVTRPLSVGLSMTTASLVKCYKGEIKTLAYPLFK